MMPQMVTARYFPFLKGPEVYTSRESRVLYLQCLTRKRKVKLGPLVVICVLTHGLVERACSRFRVLDALCATGQVARLRFTSY